MTQPQPAGAHSRTVQCRHLLYVLTLLRVGFEMVAATGLALVSGNPVYLVVPAAVTVLRIGAAGSVLLGRRWGLVVLTVLAGIDLAGFGLGAAAGLLPALDQTVTLVGLLGGVALPATQAGFCAWLLSNTPRTARPARPGPSPQPAGYLPAARPAGVAR